MTTDQLDKLKELAERATPGPWRSGQKFVQVLGGSTEPVPSLIGERNSRLIHIEEQCVTFRTYHFSRQDTCYIAAVSPDVVLELIAELSSYREVDETAQFVKEMRGLRAQLAEAREVIESIKNALGILKPLDRTKVIKPMRVEEIGEKT